MTDVEKLQERVANGITWLVEHDPGGAFHLWYEAKIHPDGPFPAHEGTDYPERYREYCKQRRKWQALSDALERVDPAWASTPPYLGPTWQGNPAAIRTR